jgi:hypothetical protein
MTNTVVNIASRSPAQNARLKFNEAINLLRGRLSAFLGYSHDGARDLYATFGYPRSIATDFLWTMYLRGGIPNRIIRTFPQATWRDCPSIGDGEGDSAETGESYSEFSHEVERLFKKHNVLSYLERVDRMSSIGRYGVLVMGFKGASNLNQPLTGQAELIYLAPYSEMNTIISQWDTDTGSPRYGLPTLYTVKGSSFIDGGETRKPTQSFIVHHSRVLHVAEFLEEDDVYGTPRLLPIINYLMDLEKVIGGSAETFWLCANRGISLMAEKEASLTDEQTADIKKQLEAFVHQQQRYLAGQGMKAEVLGSDTPDPGPNVDKLLDLIGGATRIPKRILVGSERGELSSGQDENAWNLVIDERRKSFAGPRLLQPFLMKMIETGNLPEPKPKEKPRNTSGEKREPITLYKPPAPTPPSFGNKRKMIVVNVKDKTEDGKEVEFDITWPETATIGPVEESTVMANKTAALTNYAKSPGVELIVPVPEFRRDFLGMSPESEYELPELEEPLPEEELDEEGNPVVPSEGTSPEEPVANASIPRTLYVRRDVLNASQIYLWMKKQGIGDALKDLHVTVCYSRAKIDWMNVTPDWMMSSDPDETEQRLMIPPGGARVVELMGDNGDKVLALKFQNSTLQWRHEEFRRSGASHDWGDYQPHISLAKVADNFDPSDIEPYQGAIALSHEIFEELEE